MKLQILEPISDERPHPDRLLLAAAKADHDNGGKPQCKWVDGVISRMVGFDCVLIEVGHEDTWAPHSITTGEYISPWGSQNLDVAKMFAERLVIPKVVESAMESGRELVHQITENTALKAALREYRGAYEAAEAEGWAMHLKDGHLAILEDIWLRRFFHAHVITDGHLKGIKL